MACKGFWEYLLRLLNFLMTLVGLAMVGFGIYLLVKYERAEDSTLSLASISDDHDLIQLGRPVLMSVSLANSIFDDLPKAWYVCCSFFFDI